jgi:diguanylate cyclase (GGDEF)-like protein
MTADVSKQLDRAKRFLEKNRVEDAIEAYLAVLNDAPSHQEATQALGDLYARLEQPDRAAVYYGMFFDLLIEPRDETKALAIYNRFLRTASVQQPPERIARYGFLLQKQNRVEDAMDQYTRAAELFTAQGRPEDALFCWERLAQLEPEKLERQLRLGEAAAQIGKNSIAARAFLRAGQLATAFGAEPDALEHLGRAHQLAPNERSVALLYAEAKLRAGAAQDAAAMLEPFSASENDAAFLEIFGDALTRAGQLDRAREVLERLLREKNAGAGKLFDLASQYARSKQEGKAIEILLTLKRRMFADKHQNEFADQVDGVAEKNLSSLPVVEFWAGLYNEINRESKYFEILLRLFDLYVAADNVQKARDAIERLVDIDPYDYRIQERLEKLRGKVDDGFLKGLAGRVARSDSSTAPASGPAAGHVTTETQASGPVTEEGREQQALEDLIVQTEIFLQYSLQSKALERLQKIASMFPGEEDRNARLRSLYELANWWPAGAPKPAAAAQQTHPVVEAQPVSATGKTGTYSAETLRDLTKISEITQKIYRQQTPRAMLNTAVNDVGGYLNAARALAVVGAPGRPPEMAVEFCAHGVKPAPAAQIMLLLAQMEKAQPDSLGGLIVEATPGSILRELGLSTVLGVALTDKETQAPAGMLLVAHADEHEWKANETYFLQAVGDQMLMSVSHTRLRSLVRRMGVSDERTGLLSRTSYMSCLMTEADRARSQGTPLSMTIIQVDRGAELIRQQGDSPLERYVEQLARSLQPMVRQNDVAVKYTAWSLAFVLPDTTLSGASNLAEKLRRAAATVRPPWEGGTPVTLSAAIVEAVPRADFDCEDIVTDLMNRVEFSLEEVRKRGGDTVVALEAPKL